MFRMERVNSEIMKALLKIVSSMNDKRITDKFVAFSFVDTAPDLKFCKVGISGEEAKELAKLLNNCKGFIKRELSNKISIKTIPDLLFVADDTEEKANRIEEILKQIKNS